MPGGGLALPVFSPDGRSISLPAAVSRKRDEIWIVDTATGQRRLGVGFPERFRMYFRANWIDNGNAFVVNRYHTVQHIVLFDSFRREQSQ